MFELQFNNGLSGSTGSLSEKFPPNSDRLTYSSVVKYTIHLYTPGKLYQIAPYCPTALYLLPLLFLRGIVCIILYVLYKKVWL